MVTSQNAVDGNLQLGTNTTPSTLLMDELVINSQLQFNQQQQYNDDLVEFRRNLQNLIKIEEERIREFDLNFSLEKLRQDTEDTRRNEFNIKNGK